MPIYSKGNSCSDLGRVLGLNDPGPRLTTASNDKTKSIEKLEVTRDELAAAEDRLKGRALIIAPLLSFSL